MSKEKYENIVREVLGALTFLKKEQDRLGRWEDPANPVEKDKKGSVISGSGQIMACEGLLSFLVPLRRFVHRPDILERIYAIYPREQLVVDIQTLVADLLKQSQFGGSPYVKLMDTSGREHPFLDTVCYTVSLITLSEAVFGAPPNERERGVARQAMDFCLDFLEGAMAKDSDGRVKGWCFTNFDVPSRPFKYATWMATDTLSDLLAIDRLNEKYFISSESIAKIGQFRLALASIKVELDRIYVKGRHSDEEKSAFGGRNILITSGEEVREDKYDSGYSFGLWIIMALLYLDYEDPAVLANALKLLGGHLQNDVARMNLLKNDCNIQFETDREFKPDLKKWINVLVDRSFLPQFVKATAMITSAHPNFGTFDLMERSLAWLLDNRVEDCPAWDLHAQKGDYAIYQTERAIEALCRVSDVYCEVKPASPQQEFARPLAANNSDQTILAIAETVARHAVVININGKGVDAVVDRSVENRLAEMGSRWVSEATTELAKPLTDLSASLNKLADALTRLPATSDEATVIDAIAEFRRLNEIITKAVEGAK